VPEASVMRRVQALSGIIGRKEYRRLSDKCAVKSVGSTYELLHILSGWRTLEDAGIFGGAVKCVDIEKNTKGEGRHLERI
jgi:hypothetical protein